MTKLFEAQTSKDVEDALNQGEDINQLGDYLSLILNPLCYAISQGNLEVVDALLINGANPINKDLELGAIQLAACGASVEIIDRLIQANVDVNDISNKYQITPLYYASALGNINVVKYLLEKGANVNLGTVFSGNMSSLFCKINQSHMDIIFHLSNKGININLEDTYRKSIEFGSITPLDVASKELKLDVVDILLKNGANVNAKNLFGLTPIFNCSINGSISIFDKLIRQGANVNEQDCFGFTPLMYCIFYENFDITEKLYQLDADIDIQNNYGDTALILATKLKLEKWIKFLLKHKANVSIKNNDGKIARDYAQNNRKLISIFNVFKNLPKI